MDSTPTQQRHHPEHVKNRALMVIGIVVFLLIIFGGFAWRAYFYYTEYKLGTSVVDGDKSGSRSALHTLAIMRGVGLIVAGVVLFIALLLDYFKEPEAKRQWVAKDTVELIISIVFIAGGIVLFNYDQYALLGMGNY